MLLKDMLHLQSCELNLTMKQALAKSVLSKFLLLDPVWQRHPKAWEAEKRVKTQDRQVTNLEQYELI